MSIKLKPDLYIRCRDRKTGKTMLVYCETRYPFALHYRINWSTELQHDDQLEITHIQSGFSVTQPYKGKCTVKAFRTVLQRLSELKLDWNFGVLVHSGEHKNELIKAMELLEL